MKENSLELETKDVLLKLVNVLESLTYDVYVAPIAPLDNATIGQHTRHIIELFLELQKAASNEIVNYDARKRDKRIETDIDFAIDCVGQIIGNLNKKNINLKLATNNHAAIIETNYARELLYNVEHCVHHQAIIRIGLNILGIKSYHRDFGYASSTIKHKKNVYS